MFWSQRDAPKPQRRATGHVVVNVVESSLVEQTTARQHAPTRDRGSTHRSPAEPSHGFSRRRAGLLHPPARERLTLPSMSSSDRPPPWKRFKAAAPLLPCSQSSRRTRRRHIRTRSCTARWSCFSPSILCPNPASRKDALLSEPDCEHV
jgi:hypothetical protein